MPFFVERTRNGAPSPEEERGPYKTIEEACKMNKIAAHLADKALGGKVQINANISVHIVEKQEA